MQFGRRSAVFTALMPFAALALAGCSTELDGFGSKPSAIEANRVLNAPTGVVETASLPAPSTAPPPVTSTGSITPLAGNAPTSAATAITPRTAANTVPLSPPPTNPGATAYAPSAASEQLAGAWKFSWDDGRNTCPIKLSPDRGMSGLAAQADISCPGEIFMTKGWSMMGPDIVLQNHQGKVTARLSPDGPNRFVGKLSDDSQTVAISR